MWFLTVLVPHATCLNTDLIVLYRQDSASSSLLCQTQEVVHVLIVSEWWSSLIMRTKLDSTVMTVSFVNNDLLSLTMWQVMKLSLVPLFVLVSDLCFCLVWVILLFYFGFVSFLLMWDSELFENLGTCCQIKLLASPPFLYPLPYGFLKVDENFENDFQGNGTVMNVLRLKALDERRVSGSLDS